MSRMAPSPITAYLDKLPAATQRDIVTLFTFAPSEIEGTAESFRELLLNTEFEDPSRPTF